MFPALSVSHLRPCHFAHSPPARVVGSLLQEAFARVSVMGASIENWALKVKMEMSLGEEQKKERKEATGSLL